MANSENYYDILGVSHDADAKTIKRAFLKLARTLHPDVNDSPDAEEKFKKVNEAYSVLSDPQKRSNYDRYGSAEGPAGFGGGYTDMSDFFSGAGFDVNDIFSSFFGGAASASRGSTQRSAGRDMSITISISLEEAAAGLSKKISYERLAPCDDCDGTGAEKDAHEVACKDCDGKGFTVRVEQTVFGRMQSQAVCTHCMGRGKVFDKPCETCQGQGRAPSRENVRISIPAGVHDQQVLTLKDKGEAGMLGAASGSLLVRIHVKAHSQFERQGDDLYMKLSIDSLEAIAGTTCEVPGILKDEKVSISVPSSCEYGQQIQLPKKGMPRLNSHARGSLIVVVEVKAPKSLSKEQKATIAEMVKERASANAAS